MRIGIASAGSRGDVQPFLALAVAIQRRGHAVTFATCTPFQAQVEAAGVRFAGIGGDIRTIVGDEGRAALERAGTNPFANVSALRRYVGPLVREGLERLPEALAGCDVVLGQLLAPGAASVAEALGVPYADVAYVPIRPTRAFPHPGASASTPTGVASLLTWHVAEQVFWQAFRKDIADFRRSLGLRELPWLGPPRAKALIGCPLIEPPPDWTDVYVTGPWSLEEAWEPPRELLEFLGTGPAVYVGFGSMTAPDPEALTRVVIGAARRAGVRLVLSPGWGGLSGVRSEDVCLVGDIPHHWLFPRMAGVVHHGGASTTAAALRAGVPQLVVPFLADQPFWGHRVAQAGVAPSPIPVRGLEEGALAEALRRFPSLAARAAEVGEQVRAARGVEAAAEWVEGLGDASGFARKGA